MNDGNEGHHPLVLCVVGMTFFGTAPYSTALRQGDVGDHGKSARAATIARLRCRFTDRSGTRSPGQ